MVSFKFSVVLHLFPDKWSYCTSRAYLNRTWCVHFRSRNTGCVNASEEVALKLDLFFLATGCGEGRTLFGVDNVTSCMIGGLSTQTNQIYISVKTISDKSEI